MSEDLTHYDVLGVEPSADKDTVRDAYQARLAEVQADVQREQSNKKPDQTSIDGFRREEASIRSAWQVLSDPYQRGRYDATLEMGGDADAEAESDAYDDDSANGDRTPARAGARNQRERQPYQRPPGMFSPEPLPKPASWPPNVQPPPSRARTIALFIDIFVLYIFMTVSQVAVVPQLLESQYPVKYDRLVASADCIDRLEAELDRDSTSVARIERVENHRDCRDAGVAFAVNKAGKTARLEADVKRVEDERDELIKDIQPLAFAVQFGTLVVLLLYLVPSSVLTGRTLGKKLMQIRAVNQDGSRLRLRGALLRYGLPVIIAQTLSSLVPAFQPFVFILVLFGVMSWPRNPNLQGMHDRFAKTIVVDG